MPNFSKTHIDTPDIDPEALTVHLLGPEPDADDLVKEPENVKMPAPKKRKSAKKPKEESSETVSSDESEEVTSATKKSIHYDDATDTGEMDEDDEKEIRAIEEMLLSKQSKIAKMKHAKDASKASALPKQPKKIDPIVIVSAIAATALIVVFAAYFAGFFDSKASLGMTLDQFSSKYSQTEYMEIMGDMVFTFPDMTLIDDSNTAADGTAPTTHMVSIGTGVNKVSFSLEVPIESVQDGGAKSKASEELQFFTGTVQNSLDSVVVVSGKIYKSDTNIKAMRVIIRPGEGMDMTSVSYICIPYLQTLYPDMTAVEAISALADCYNKTEHLTIKDSFGFAFRAIATQNGTYYIFDIIPQSAEAAYLKNT
jgi:hypothetical protein